MSVLSFNEFVICELSMSTPAAPDSKALPRLTYVLADVYYKRSVFTADVRPAGNQIVHCIHDRRNITK